jgi:predicted esterase
MNNYQQTTIKENRNKEEMNVGILHGCRQSSEVISSLLKDYVKKLKTYNPSASFFFLDGAFDYSEFGKMWYRTELCLEGIGTDDIPEADIESTLDYVSSFVKTNKINIFIGFSQGGNVIDSYLRLRNIDTHIQTAIIMSGYSFPRYQNLMVSIPVLFIASQSDEIVPFSLLPSGYTNKTLMEHDKGHKIQLKKSFVNDVAKWLINVTESIINEV